MSPRRNVVAKAGVLRGFSASLLASERQLQKNRRFTSCIGLRHLIGFYCVLFRKGSGRGADIFIPRALLLLPIAPVHWYRVRGPWRGPLVFCYACTLIHDAQQPPLDGVLLRWRTGGIACSGKFR